MKGLEGRSVIVIGAGIAGLSAGIYAQMNGYRSRVIERHSVPGGMAACWQRKGYLVDGGIHFITGHNPGVDLHRFLDETGILDAAYVDMEVYGRFVDEASGVTFDITSDPERVRTALRERFPEDGKVVDQLVDAGVALSRKDTTVMGMDKAPELMKMGDKARMTWDLGGVIKYFMGRWSKPMTEYTRRCHDPVLRDALQWMFLPEAPAWFVIMLLGLLFSSQLGLVRDGSASIARAMERRYVSLGGSVDYGSAVTQVLVEEDAAVGVVMEDGAEHRANAVIGSCDGWELIYGMLGGRYIEPQLDKWHRERPLMRPLTMVTFGVGSEYDEEPWLTIHHLEEPMEVAGEEHGHLLVRFFNHSDSFSPEGRTVVQVMLETPWAYWNDLYTKDRDAYRAAKDSVALTVLQRLEGFYPGLSGLVEMTDVATPVTYWRYTGSREGSYMGWSFDASAVRVWFPRKLPGLERFYMAGQWSMSLGGFIPAMFSGRHAVQVMCADDGRIFGTDAKSPR